MEAHVDETLKQLHELVAELEARARSAAGAAGEGGAEVAGKLRAALAAARARMAEVEHSLARDAGRGAKAADEFVRENAWMSIGIAAAVAFVLGALFARRD
jgi:ElaB/YqjD/DUF883 family membrane-anchored ribosome-binding protein